MVVGWSYVPSLGVGRRKRDNHKEGRKGYPWRKGDHSSEKPQMGKEDPPTKKKEGGGKRIKPPVPFGWCSFLRCRPSSSPCLLGALPSLVGCPPSTLPFWIVPLPSLSEPEPLSFRSPFIGVLPNLLYIKLRSIKLKTLLLRSPKQPGWKDLESREWYLGRYLSCYASCKNTGKGPR